MDYTTGRKIFEELKVIQGELNDLNSAIDELHDHPKAKRLIKDQYEKLEIKRDQLFREEYIIRPLFQENEHMKKLCEIMDKDYIDLDVLYTDIKKLVKDYRANMIFGDGE